MVTTLARRPASEADSGLGKWREFQGRRKLKGHRFPTETFRMATQSSSTPGVGVPLENCPHGRVIKEGAQGKTKTGSGRIVVPFYNLSVTKYLLKKRDASWERWGLDASDFNHRRGKEGEKSR